MNSNHNYYCAFISCSVLNQSNNWDPQFEFTYRGLVPMKGKPEPMKVWILTRKRADVENTEALQQQQQ